MFGDGYVDNHRSRIRELSRNKPGGRWENAGAVQQRLKPPSIWLIRPARFRIRGEPRMSIAQFNSCGQ